MRYWLVPFTSDWKPAVARCNERLRSSGAAPFLLTTDATEPWVRGPLRKEHWLAVSGDEVHGGCLLQMQPAWITDEQTQAVNIQSPLSEGITDPQHAPLALWMLKEVERRFPFCYSVGMGSEQAPYPRLLKAMRWRLEAVPFYFRVLSGRRVLAELAPLRRHHKIGWAARAGAWIPVLPDVAFATVHRMRAVEPSSGTSVTGEADWARIRTGYGFGIERSEEMLSALYGDPSRFEQIRVPGGVAVLCRTGCRNHPYFGNLRLATLVDVLAAPGAARRTIDSATAAARTGGADLLVTNQSAPEIQTALQQAGWLSYSSNYLVGFSPALTKRVAGAPVFITRGDGDGLLNL